MVATKHIFISILKGWRKKLWQYIVIIMFYSPTERVKTRKADSDWIKYEIKDCVVFSYWLLHPSHSNRYDIWKCGMVSSIVMGPLVINRFVERCSCYMLMNTVSLFLIGLNNDGFIVSIALYLMALYWSWYVELYIELISAS